MPGPLGHTNDHKNSHTSNCAAPSPPAFKTIRDHDEHKFGGKNQFRNALPMVMIRLLITFRYFTIGTQNGLGKKIIVIKKKKTKGRICAMLTVTTKHLPELQCSVTIILCRTVMFSARGLVGGWGSRLKRKCVKEQNQTSFVHQVHFKSSLSRSATQCSAKKMCSKANMITFLFKKLNHQGVLCKKIMCKIYPCMDFKN